MNDTPHIPTQFIAPVDAPAPMPSAEQHDRPTASRPTCPSTGTFTCPPQTACDTCAPLCVDMGDVAPERDAEAVDATPAAPAPRPEAVNAEGPAPMAAGTYAVYDDQAGGYVLVVATREGQTHHKHIPARVVKMAEMAMGGNSPLAAMFGGI